MKRNWTALVAMVCLFSLAACSVQSAPSQSAPVFATPTLMTQLQNKTAVSTPTEPMGQPTQVVAQTSAEYRVQVDVKSQVHPISSLIYGVSGASQDALDSLNPTLNSWGGNASTRYNWTIGHAWNAGSDWEYRNGNYGTPEGSASDNFVAMSQKAGSKVRLVVPTLGWVAKNDDNNTCSFPLPGGGCGNANGASCQNKGEVANPDLANVSSSADNIAAWLRHLTIDQGFQIDYVALDNEPELWGVTHYDVHPTCTTYQEILDKYIEYAAAVHQAAPQSKLVGPMTCCWYYLWNSPAGKLDKLKHLNQDFLPWFLQNVRAADQKSGWRSLDVLDIHYYPEGLYNDKADETTSAWRLRSTRSLWDPAYTDESWINEPVYLIPRLKKLIDEFYPGTQLGISEWNWGADQTMNGALAIADVLGIFGRENLYYAAYWMTPPAKSAGEQAFRIYTNYDGKDGKFGDTSVLASSNKVDVVGSYAALDSKTGKLHVILINKDPAKEIAVNLALGGFGRTPEAEVYTLSQSDPGAIHATSVKLESGDMTVKLAPYSIAHYVFSPAR